MAGTFYELCGVLFDITTGVYDDTVDPYELEWMKLYRFGRVSSSLDFVASVSLTL